MKAGPTMCWVPSARAADPSTVESRRSQAQARRAMVRRPMAGKIADVRRRTATAFPGGKGTPVSCHSRYSSLDAAANYGDPISRGPKALCRDGGRSCREHPYLTIAIQMIYPLRQSPIGAPTWPRRPNEGAYDPDNVFPPTPPKVAAGPRPHA